MDLPETPSNNDKNNDKCAQRTKKFQSGNKLGKGRPQGSRNKVTLAMEHLLDSEAETLTRKAIEMALDGDMMALRLCMERLYPPRKDKPIQIEDMSISGSADALDALGKIVEAVLRGEITPQEGISLTNVIESYRQTALHADLEARAERIEEALGNAVKRGG